MDMEQAAQAVRDHINSEAKSNGPGAVLLTVVDGSQQLNYGYVWANYGDKRVQCIAPATVGDLTTATESTPMLVWAIPPNPDQAAGYTYLAIAFAQRGGTSAGYAPGRVPPLFGTVVNDPDGNPITGGGGSGTVTSVALTMPTSEFNVSGSPVTTSGTLAVSWDNQSANTVFAGPTGGGAATPAFRALVAADIPDISATYIAKAFMAAKGDLISASANDTPVILSVGSNGTVLVADSTQTSGLAWGTRALVAQADVYTADDTWTKPAGAKMVEVILIGGGGGGGSGRKSGSNTQRRGGSGGGGGQIARHVFIASLLDATVTVDIGAAGSGGAAQTAGSTDGNNGNDGSNTRFVGVTTGTVFLLAGGGKKGLGGTNGTAVGGQGGTAWDGTNQTAGDGQYGGGEIGGNGGDGSTPGGAGEHGGGGGGGAGTGGGAAAAGGGSVYGAAGGASGGGSTGANNTVSAAGVGGNYQSYATGGGGTAGSAPSGAGGNGGSPPYTRWGGAGGGGGGAGINGANNTAGGTGGNGGNYGAGGGGGGCGTGTGDSGAGGSGAAGLAVIITYF